MNKFIKLRGTIFNVGKNHVILEAGQVGYVMTTFSSEGFEVDKIMTVYVIRLENPYKIRDYAFVSEADRELYEKDAIKDFNER